eukprot:TRINITY_DN10889_c0_g1_i2.p1 TRINITY_DN10889_c0_g1~~TRINITY_DN10889_c0_g1_i2.p1  ORF type:complete len:547 (+),score=99.63 TRINITY_DN10889_c0_g1_i2:150-1643(+)
MRQVLSFLLLLLFCLQRCSAYYFLETFDKGWDERWKHSEDDQYTGVAEVDQPANWNDTGLKLPTLARHYGLAALTQSAIDPSKGLVIQYEVRAGPAGWSCGGAYLKFLTYEPDFKPEDLVQSTPYTIMFGPDKCGTTDKVHFIMRHKSPKSGEIEEKHLSSPPSTDSSKFTAVYTLILKADNTFEMLVNDKKESSGSLYDSFTPAINPPEEIDDPEDQKPEDWVDVTTIPDPEATKPEDWDEDAPEYIDDPEAEKPADWDDEEDGDWAPPQISNPDYKGKWTPPMIENPEYKGPWRPRKIPNPDYYDDETPMSHIGKIGGVALEVWTMDKDFYFDNILITDSAIEAAEYRKVWRNKRDAEEAAKLQEDKEVMRESASGGAKKIRELVDAATFLDPYRQHIDPYLEVLDQNPNYAYVILAFPLITIVFLTLYCCVGGRKQTVSTEEARRTKKEDEPTPDDAEEENAEQEGEEGEEEQQEGEGDEGQGTRRRGRTSRAD